MIKPPQKKSLQALKKDLDKVFNAFIRLRDQKNGTFECVSCGETKSVSQMHAGHYYSAGHHSAIRWDEDNVHGQCVHCNTFLHGNLIGYQSGILKRIGNVRLRFLIERKNNRSKMMSFEVTYLIQEYKEKVKKFEAD